MARISFNKADEWDNRHETKASIKRRISENFGFKAKSITLLEASYDRLFVDNGIGYLIADKVAFSVNGIGYTTDFQGLTMNEAFDA